MKKIEWFDLLVELDPAQRALKLDEIRATDTDLAAQLQRLLALDVVGANQPDALGSQLSDQLNLAIAQTVQARTKIGSYRLLGLLGQGGMGEVWRAERDIAGNTQPLALKILKLEDMSAEAHERFALEQRTLLKLVHPNIARLLDAGVASDSRPWIAMELVEGMPITQYCDQHKLSVNARLVLFRQVIAAVQYAHDYFIVHRDIKPDNVLVDAAGNVKLLDFGIAKTLDRHAPHTLTQQRFFSLYATAPEQLLGGSVCVGTDVYALGGLLYELLSGAPLISQVLRTPAQLQSFIVEKTPTLPSKIVDASAAINRGAASCTKLSANLRGDLDRIVLHALRKLPSERYASAREFDEDIQAFLEHRPVKAAGQGRRYRVMKFLRRHWLAASISGFVLASLLLLTVLLAMRSNTLALETSRANIEAKSAGALSEFWQDLFATADPNRSKGKNLSVRDVLDAGMLQLDSKLGEAPIARVTLLLTIAKTYRQLSVMDSAKVALLKAKEVLGTSDQNKLLIEVELELARVLADMDDAKSALLVLARAKMLQEAINAPPLERAVTLNIWGSILNDLLDYKLAAEKLAQALKLRTDNSASATEIAGSTSNLAYALSKLGQLTQANKLFKQAYQLRLNALGKLNVEVAFTQLNLARTERDLGHFRVADQALAEVLSVLNTLFPDANAPHPAMAIALFEQAISLRMQDQNAEAAEVFGRVSAIMNRQAKNVVIGPLRERSMAWLALGESQAALADIEVCLVEAKKLAQTPQSKLTMAGCQWRAAQIYQMLGKPVAAKILIAKSLEVYQHLDPTLVPQMFEKAQALVVQMQLAQALGQSSAAEDARLQSIELLKPLHEYWLVRQLLLKLVE